MPLYGAEFLTAIGFVAGFVPQQEPPKKSYNAATSRVAILYLGTDHNVRDFGHIIVQIV